MKVSTWPPDGLDRRIMEMRVHCSLRTDMIEYSGDSFFCHPGWNGFVNKCHRM